MRQTDRHTDRRTNRKRQEQGHRERGGGVAEGGIDRQTDRENLKKMR